MKQTRLLQLGLGLCATAAGWACINSTPPPESSTSGAQASTEATETAKQPALAPTRRVEQVDELHGVKVADPYRWLEDVKSEEVQAWMKERDSYARAAIDKFPYRKELKERLGELLYVDTQSAPIERGGYYFYSKKNANQEKSVYFVKTGKTAEQRVLLDPNSLSKDGSISIGAYTPSKDGKFVAYMERGNNADESIMRVIDVATGKLRGIDTIEGLRYTSASWMPDSSGFYYTWIPKDAKIPPNERMGYGEVRFHKLGTAASEDKTIREKTGNPQRWMDARVSDDGKYLVLYISLGWSVVDVYLMDLTAKKPAWQELAVGNKALYQVRVHQNKLYILTNEGAPRYRVLSTTAGKLARKDWQEIVPEDASAVISDIDIIGGRLSLRYLDKAAHRLEFRDLEGKNAQSIALPAIGRTSPLIGHSKSKEAYYSFESFNQSQTIYKLDVDSLKAEVYARTSLKIQPDEIAVEQVFYPSKDGTKVSMFIIRRKDMPKGETQPTLLYGYGGFNISLTPRFSAFIQAWVERGGIFVQTNLRGGGEYGEAWHQAGMLGNKQNVFDDFIAAGEYLVKEKYTTSAELAIAGRSNGGLLVGATMTQRPDLFGAVICGVPLLDMVRYHKFGVGKAWIPEYGSAEDPEQFKWLYAYSPYHQVKKGTKYPKLLMAATDSDDRVDPLHARKFVAMIEHATGGEEPLLRIERNAGHGGGGLRKATQSRMVDELSFLLETLGEPKTVRAF